MLNQTLDQVSALSRRLVGLEKEYKDPDGTIAKLEAKIKTLEDHWGGDTIKQGGKTFHGVIAVNAWVQTFKNKDLFRYCIDMVTLIMLCAEPYDTIAEGMAIAAAAHKAEYNSLTEARISLSYGLTYPENIMPKQDKEKYAATGGWYWTTTWSSFAVFKGTFNNKAKESITSSLLEVLRVIQNAIDYPFPPANHPIAHAVFTEQLLISRQQASGWIEALEPLYEILPATGMPSDKPGNMFSSSVRQSLMMCRW
jgi:hypothetical protein